MELFDDYNRDDSQPKKHSESEYEFINRSAKEWVETERNILADWFSHYPDKDKAHLRGHFKSKISNQHNSAFFELFLHELLLKLGAVVEIHPELDDSTRRPDFLVKSPDGNVFFLEAIVSIEQSKEEIAAGNRKNIVYDVLNKIDTSYFWLHLEEKGIPQSRPRTKGLKEKIEKWLGNLNHEELYELLKSNGLNVMPIMNYDHDGWNIEISPIPKNPEEWEKPGGRAIGINSEGAKWVSPKEYLKKAIVNKASGYGKLELPYVVAVNPSDFFISSENVIDALFGSISVEVSIEDSKYEPKMIRELDGVWISTMGPTNTNISAVLVVSNILIPNLSNTDICLYHHPWAESPYDSLLTRLNQGKVDDDKMRYYEGESLESIFGIIPFL